MFAPLRRSPGILGLVLFLTLLAVLAVAAFGPGRGRPVAAGDGPVLPAPGPGRAYTPQSTFTDSGQELGGSVESSDVALGDVDGDGDLDAIVASYGAASKVYTNQGGDQGGTAGVFVDSGQSLGVGQAVDVELQDLDGDSDLDAFLLRGAENEVWLNQGVATGVFSQTNQIFGDSSSWSVALGDLDGVGGPDAFVGRFGGQPSKVWFNDGSGTFADSGQALDDDSFDLALGDVDGDGDLDAFSANGAGNKVWVNLGGEQDGEPGIFIDSGQLLSSTLSLSVSLGDVDGDGDLDAYAGNDQADQVWINQGGDQGGTAGAFADSGQALGGSADSSDVGLSDLDGDGDLDAFTAVYGAPNKVYINQGFDQGGTQGAFADSGQNLGSANSQGLALGDLDGDGDVDAFVANWSQPDTVWLNEADADRPPRHFVRIESHVVDAWAFVVNVRLRDLDQDGDLDLVVSSITDEDLEFMENDGSANFSSMGRWNSSAEITRDGLAIGDLDGDNDLDILTGLATTSLLNDGDGNFSAGAPVPWAAQWLVAGDFDGDGDLDSLASQAFSEEAGQAHLWLNQGVRQGGVQGQLVDDGYRFEEAFPVEGITDVGDVDGDGDIDVVIEHGIESDGEEHQLWLNQGGAQGGTEGDFAFSGQSFGGAGTTVRLADMDGDGDLDAFVGRRDPENRQGLPDEVWLQNGGVFADSGQRLGAEATSEAVVGDVDLDGDVDIVASAFSGNEPGQVWLNGGGWQGGQAGIFEAGEPYLTGSHAIVHLGDLDGDGYPDGVDNWAPLYLWLNRPTPALGSAGFLNQSLPPDEEGGLLYDWWENSNALLPVALRESLSLPVEMETQVYFSEDLLQFPPGEMVDLVTAGADEPGGKEERIWNPYFGTLPVLGETAEAQVQLIGNENLAVDGPDTLTVVFHNPDAALRRCFLEGIEFLYARLLPSEEGLARATSLLTHIDLALFRALRDDVMADTVQGRYYTALYRAHSPELLQITTRNLSLLGLIDQGLETWTPHLRALVEGNGDAVTITREMVGQAEFILDIYGEGASPELAQIIREEREALDLRAFEGMTMDEALARVNERELASMYLPVIEGD